MHSRCGGRERQTRRREPRPTSPEKNYNLENVGLLLADRNSRATLPLTTPHSSRSSAGNSETETGTFWFASQADFPYPRSDGPMSLSRGQAEFPPRVVTVQKVDPFEAKMKISRLSFPKVSIHLWRKSGRLSFTREVRVQRAIHLKPSEMMAKLLPGCKTLLDAEAVRPTFYTSELTV